MTISIIAAMSENRVIGLRNRLPWKLPADLANFKRITLGHTLLMGRKTFESIGRPLPGRKTIIITHDRDFCCEGVLTADGVDHALKLAEQVEPPEGEIFVAGGAQIYRQTINVVSRMYLTIVHGRFRGDTYFPDFDPSSWKVLRSVDREADDKNAWDLTFQTLERRGETELHDVGPRLKSRETKSQVSGAPKNAGNGVKRQTAPGICEPLRGDLG